MSQNIRLSRHRAHARTIISAEAFLNKKDEFVLLRLDTADEEIWLRLGRANFQSLEEYLSSEARWIRGH
jgi:hypothetical protein